MSLALSGGMKVRTTRARHALGIALGLIFGFAITSPVGVAALGMLPVISVLTPSQNQAVTGTVSFYAAADTSDCFFWASELYDRSAPRRFNRRSSSMIRGLSQTIFLPNPPSGRVGPPWRVRLAQLTVFDAIAQS